MGMDFVLHRRSKSVYTFKMDDLEKETKQRIEATQNIVDVLHDGRDLRDAQIFMATTDEKYFVEAASRHGLDWGTLSQSEKEQFVCKLLADNQQDA
jgi:hypothetical protein